MPRKPKAHREETLEDLTSSVDPYKTLGIDKSATPDQVKSAYRKAALKHHPDKVSSDEKDEANKLFQEIAFAYAVLSDERRRKRYDTTGNTAESLNLEDDDFSWTDFFREQTEAMVDGSMLDKIKKEYQGSQEENDDILRVYEEYQGDMDAVYEEIMCSNVLEDDARFRKIIDAAIEDGSVKAYKKYTKETTSSKKARAQKARKEEKEAMELAEELGVKDKLFGKSNGTSKKKGGNDEDALKALIQQRQKGRAEDFFDQLEAKYGGGKKSKRKNMDEPSEEAFQKNSKKNKP